MAFAKAPLLAAHAEPATTATLAPKAGGNATAGSSDQIQPLLVKTITYRTAPLQTASLAPLPALVPAPGSRPQSAVAAPVRAVPAAQPPEPQTTVVVASTEPAPIASTPKAEPAKPEPPKAEQAKPEAAKLQAMKPEAVKPEAAKTVLASLEPTPARIRARGGWLIQIGAFEGEDEAKEHLSDARHKARATLASADPFTERVQKGDKTLYRARFAGFDKTTAETACKQLKRSDIACIMVKY